MHHIAIVDQSSPWILFLKLEPCLTTIATQMCVQLNKFKLVLYIFIASFYLSKKQKTIRLYIDIRAIQNSGFALRRRTLCGSTYGGQIVIVRLQ